MAETMEELDFKIEALDTLMKVAEVLGNNTAYLKYHTEQVIYKNMKKEMEKQNNEQNEKN